MRIVTSLLCLASLTYLPSAYSGTITEYNRSTFQTALGNSTVSGQDFDTLPLGTITTVNGVTYTPSMGTALVTSNYLTTTNPNGLGSTSEGFFEANETLTITFSAPITAFALDINTYASNSGDYEATVNDGSNGTAASVFDTFPNYETGQFIGFTDSSSFTTATISAVSDPGTGNGFCGSASTCPYTVDTLVYGSAAAIAQTPEPSSFALLGLGMLAIAIPVMRRTSQSATAL